MSSPPPKPPNTAPMTGRAGTPNKEWAAYFDRMTRSLEAVRVLGGFGSLLPVAHPNPVPGYVRADGAAVSRKDNPGTFALMGTDNGIGDGSTTFNLPTVADDGPIRWHVRIEAA